MMSIALSLCSFNGRLFMMTCITFKVTSLQLRYIIITYKRKFFVR
jgi:hypothetical protein